MVETERFKLTTLLHSHTVLLLPVLASQPSFRPNLAWGVKEIHFNFTIKVVHCHTTQCDSIT